jgi:aminodeoxyfutalosine deaminase
MTESGPQPWTLTARWVFPGDGPPLERGTVTLAGGRIVAVEPHGRRKPDLDVGNAAVLPGLVNAHTHLDLSGLRGLAPPSPDFTGWLRAVIRHRREQSPGQVEADVRFGLSDAVRTGTTLLGDISASGQSWTVLAEAPVRAVVFYELLGLPQARAEQALAAARTWLEARPPSAICRPGLSPHAPYSVRAWLFGQAALLARGGKQPLAVHLAESREELELLHHGRGPFVTFLQELGVWDKSGLADSPKQVLKLCYQWIPKLFVHCNYLAPSARIPRGSSIVYCPRTHAAFGHPPHPFRDFLARGVRVALGTDSLASNPDLDLLAEARFLHKLYPDFPGAALVRMATLSGAEALGWQDETGSLTPGKSADLVVLPLPDAAPADPHRLVFDSDLPVRAVMCCGQWGWGTPEGDARGPGGGPA